MGRALGQISFSESYLVMVELLGLMDLSLVEPFELTSIVRVYRNNHGRANFLSL